MEICKIKCTDCPQFEATKKLCLLVSNKDGSDKKDYFDKYNYYDNYYRTK